MLGRVLAAVEGVGVLGVGARFVSAGGAVRNVATAEDKVEWERCVQMHATIGASNTPAPEKGGSVPPLYHWTAFQTHQAMENLGQDGHPKRGGAASDLSPDVPDTWRRMFGGSEIVYNRHPLVGEPLLRRAQIVDVIEKQGATPLKLCKIEYSYFGGNSATVRQRSAERGVDNAVFTETQTIVYIAPKEDAIAEDGVVDDNNNIAADAAASAALRHPPPPVVESPANTWIPEPACGALRSLSTNPTMLFRYSALTFNGHRIHYDLPYTMNVEGMERSHGYTYMRTCLLACVCVYVVCVCVCVCVETQGHWRAVLRLHPP